MLRKEYFKIFIAAVKKVNNAGVFQISLTTWKCYFLLSLLSLKVDDFKSGLFEGQKAENEFFFLLKLYDYDMCICGSSEIPVTLKLKGPTEFM